MSKTDKLRDAGAVAQTEVLAAYQKLRGKVKDVLQEARAVDAEAVRAALDKAGADLKRAGEYSAATVNRASEALKKDLDTTVRVLGPRLHELAEETGHAMEIWRDKGGAVLATVAQAVGEWSREFGAKLDAALVYHSGDTTRGGRFTCTACGAVTVLDQPGHLPACATCQKTEFRRA